MPEVIIKYKNSKALQALKDFAKYFNFTISPNTPGKERQSINGVTVIPADSSIQVSTLRKVFTGRNIEGADLRSRAWHRVK